MMDDTPTRLQPVIPASLRAKSKALRSDVPSWASPETTKKRFGTRKPSMENEAAMAYL